MSLAVVPTSFQMPLVRPKRVDWTPSGGDAHAESMLLHDLEVARRFAYARRGRYMCDDEDDVVVDVGGVGEPFVYPQLSDVVRRLDHEMDEDDQEEYVLEEEEGYEFVYEEEYEVDEFVYEENPMNTLTYKVEEMTRAEFDKSMEQDCPVCLEELKRADCVTTSCKHSFCAKCYKKYPKQRSCPCCRQRVEMLTRYSVDYSDWFVL
jgi:hypothetical protein